MINIDQVSWHLAVNIFVILYQGRLHCEAYADIEFIWIHQYNNLISSQLYLFFFMHLRATCLLLHCNCTVTVFLLSSFDFILSKLSNILFIYVFFILMLFFA